MFSGYVIDDGEEYFVKMIVCTLGIQKKNMTNFAKRTELIGRFGEVR